MAKILALDPGDQWIGTALSDATQILARPYKTTTTDELTKFLTKLFDEESIEIVIVGYPKTMKGTISAQTQKVINLHATLQKEFPTKNFILWDERRTSKTAQSIKSARSKDEKIQSHSIAAAVILDTYLQHLAFKKQMESED